MYIRYNVDVYAMKFALMSMENGSPLLNPGSALNE